MAKDRVLWQAVVNTIMKPLTDIKDLKFRGQLDDKLLRDTTTYKHATFPIHFNLVKCEVQSK